jgi:outer membrane lipoprotein SlyB
MEEATTVGAAGAVGAIVGGIIGGLKGALIGAAVGAGGVIAATEGKDVVLSPGTLVRVRLDTPVRIR